MLSYLELLAVQRMVTLRNSKAMWNPDIYQGIDIETVKISRRSDRQYDLTVEGKTKDGNSFSSWLVLATIAELQWTTTEIANMTDYPDMVRDGDWSGVRDTADDKLWAIFHKYRYTGV
jgi:hypothetical protein